MTVQRRFSDLGCVPRLCEMEGLQIIIADYWTLRDLNFQVHYQVYFTSNFIRLTIRDKVAFVYRKWVCGGESS
jgi:hypothetical protein